MKQERPQTGYNTQGQPASMGVLDTIYSSVSLTIAANVERLILTDTANVNATGSATQADYLMGNTANNNLNGLGGNDTLVGGAGADTFRFDTALNASTNVDFILDFLAIDDTIQLENSIFAQLTAPGALSAGLFKNLSLGAIDADDRIVYDGSTGALFYDADGSGAGIAVLFATLSGASAITNADSFVT